jgi:hypothetical protein
MHFKDTITRTMSPVAAGSLGWLMGGGVGLGMGGTLWGQGDTRGKNIGSVEQE